MRRVRVWSSAVSRRRGDWGSGFTSNERLFTPRRLLAAPDTSLTPPIPRHPDALVDPIENVLAAVAACEPFEQALATWESALNKNLVTLEALRRFPWKPAARRILEQATPFADAGLETYLRPRLRWLRLPLRIQTWIHGHRVDVQIGARLIIQIDGGTHVGAQRLEDNRHDAELRLMGYHVIRVGYQQVINEWEAVQNNCD